MTASRFVSFCGQLKGEPEAATAVPVGAGAGVGDGSSEVSVKIIRQYVWPPCSVIDELVPGTENTSPDTVAGPDSVVHPALGLVGL